MPRARAALARLAMALLLAVGPVPWGAALAQPAIDPASLVGEWMGTRSRWTPEMGQPERGQWNLIVERAEGSKVYLRREIPGTRDTSFVGTVTGNQLSIGQGAQAITFTIDGTHMTSKYRAPNGMMLEYDLRKK